MLIPQLRRFHPLTLLSAGAAAGAVGTLFARNFIPNEKKISHRIDLPYGVGDPQFERSLGQLLGPAARRRQPCDRPAKRRRNLPRHARRHGGRAAQHHAGKLHLLGGTHRGAILPALSEKARAGVRVHVLLDGLGCNCIRSALIRQMRRRGRRGRDLQHRRILRPRPHQQPHAPQAARGRWARRLHRRRGHRRRMERPRAIARPLARRALPGRGAGGRADAERVRGQLDEDGGVRPPRRRLFPGAGTGRARSAAICSRARRTRAAIRCA